MKARTIRVGGGGGGGPGGGGGNVPPSLAIVDAVAEEPVDWKGEEDHGDASAQQVVVLEEVAATKEKRKQGTRVLC